MKIFAVIVMLSLVLAPAAAAHCKLLTVEDVKYSIGQTTKVSDSSFLRFDGIPFDAGIHKYVNQANHPFLKLEDGLRNLCFTRKERFKSKFCERKEFLRRYQSGGLPVQMSFDVLYPSYLLLAKSVPETSQSLLPL